MFSCLLMASPRLAEFVKKQSLSPSSLLRLSRSIYDRVSSTLASALRLPTSFSLPDQKARRGVFRQIWISSFASVCQTNSHKFSSAGRNHGGDLDLSALYICDLHSINTDFFTYTLSSITRFVYAVSAIFRSLLKHHFLQRWLIRGVI